LIWPLGGTWANMLGLGSAWDNGFAKSGSKPAVVEVFWTVVPPFINAAFMDDLGTADSEAF
jgi:hypothetical protein